MPVAIETQALSETQRAMLQRALEAPGDLDFKALHAFLSRGRRH